MTDKPLSLKDYTTTMNIPKINLKQTIEYSKDNFQNLMDKIINKVTQTLVTDMKKEYSEFPDEVLTAFVKQYIDLEITKDENFRTEEICLTIIPTWKDVNIIDFDSEEQKLLNEYFENH